ncbi:MAG TPA: hypothetical protein VM366_01815 [Anaerolineae bacterium]|nr:hypothetical protein [Anaerolineae bacterium]
MSTELTGKRSWTFGLGKGTTRRELLMGLGALCVALVVTIPVVGRFVRDAQSFGTTDHTSSMQASALIPFVPDAPRVAEVDVDRQGGAELRADTGAALLEALGFRGKVVYLVYGRPSKRGEQTWGTLGASQTAEQSWQVLRNSASAVGGAIGQDSSSFALNVLNPVYRSQNGVIADIYIQKALELAPQNRGVVALNFNSIAAAETTIQRLETVLPEALLAYLSVGLDVEHFPGGQIDAASVNAFSGWFAGKHREWAGDAIVPGLVVVYTFRGANSGGQGSIADLAQLVQYYPRERTLVVPLFDGYGTRQAKAEKVGSLVRALPSTAESPALVGVMEFQTRWGTKYDQATIGESFSTLAGAPVSFFASQ